jgi:hypothetical protein
MFRLVGAERLHKPLLIEGPAGGDLTPSGLFWLLVFMIGEGCLVTPGETTLITTRRFFS